jgi:DNA-binding CsgD family transcriptional regulator
LSRQAVEATEPLLDEPTRQLCAAIAGGGLDPVRLAVVAPGEYGKTALLEHLARICGPAGVPVLRFGREDVAKPALVLADDAHLLGGAELDKLRRLAADERVGLVVAARPSPRLAALNDILGRFRGQIVLRPFDRAQVDEYLLSAETGQGLAEFVHTQTGGVPGLVHRLVSALGSADEPEIPEAVLAEIAGIVHTPDTLRFLLAAEAGAGLDVDLLREVLAVEAEGVAEVIDAARATGLLGPDGAPLPIGVSAVRALVPVEQRTAMRRRLAELRLKSGGPMLAMASQWLPDELTGESVAKAFEVAAQEALPTDAALAARLFDAAVAAGTPVATVSARWAEAAALEGDLNTAMRLADQAIAGTGAADRALGARVMAAALAHRGQLARSAELHRWSGGGQAKAFAAIGLIGTGRLPEAVRLLELSDVDEPPTLLSGGIDAAARGILESVTGAPTSALSTVVNAAEMLEPVGRAVLLPDSPAALAALMALHQGELAIAEQLLERAVAARTGGTTLLARHRLLLAWIAMVRGDAGTAAERLAEAGTDLESRDWMFAVALEVGLARRRSDLGALRQIWGEACEAVIRQRVDLFTLLPFGEFAVAAARLGEQDRLVPHLREARELLAALGDPPLWTASVHWSGLHAAIIAERPAEAEEHVTALAADAGRGSFPAMLSAAANCWLKVLSGTVDAPEVQAAARGLHAVGMWWDAARLAGQAAIRTSDRKVMVVLLDCARTLRGRADEAVPTPSTVDMGAGSALSEREVEVAELVLAGLTYKQAGAQLFISAKTVEHHVARMRQRLGASSRSDLLSQLRSLLGR